MNIFRFRHLFSKPAPLRIPRQPPYPYRDYNDATRSIFIHIPKNAGTSILHALGAPTDHRLHISHVHYYRSDPERFESYLKFAIIRDPIDRISSVYRYIAAGGNQDENDLRLANEISRAADDLESFILRYVSPSKLLLVELLRPQSYYICDRFGGLRVNHLLRFEHLATDYETLRTSLPSLPTIMPRLNQSKNTTPIELSSASAEKIRQLYEVDYALLYRGDRDQNRE